MQSWFMKSDTLFSLIMEPESVSGTVTTMIMYDEFTTTGRGISTAPFKDNGSVKGNTLLLCQIWTCLTQTLHNAPTEQSLCS